MQTQNRDPDTPPRDQSDNAGVVIAIAVLVVLLLGVGGYYVWNANPANNIEPAAGIDSPQAGMTTDGTVVPDTTTTTTTDTTTTDTITTETPVAPAPDEADDAVMPQDDVTADTSVNPDESDGTTTEPEPPPQP